MLHNVQFVNPVDFNGKVRARVSHNTPGVEKINYNDHSVVIHFKQNSPTMLIFVPWSNVVSAVKITD